MKRSRYDFDIYRITIDEEIGHNVVEIVDVQSWKSIRMRMTQKEIEGLLKVIEQHLELGKQDGK